MIVYMLDLLCMGDKQKIIDGSYLSSKNTPFLAPVHRLKAPSNILP